jgi:hypothetical protein
MAAPPDPIIAQRRDIYASIYGLAGVIAFLADRLHHQELGELARATMDAATVSLEGADADTCWRSWTGHTSGRPGSAPSWSASA